MRLCFALPGLALACGSATIGSESDGSTHDGCDGAGEIVAIHEIQGTGAESPLRGEQVGGVCGLVVLASRNTLYLESLVSRRDSDPATAETLRVELARETARARPGDVIAARGIVEEIARGPNDLSETVLLAEEVDWLVTAAVPAPVSAEVLLGPLPDGSPADTAAIMARYESLESGRVRLERPVVVNPTHDGVLALATDTLFERLGRTVGGGLPSEDGALAEPLLAEAAGLWLPDASVGDVFDGPLEGVVFHRDGRYRLNLVGPLPALTASARPPEHTGTGDAEGFTVATLNLAMLGGSDVARSGRFADLIARRLGAPDVVALQEIATDDPEAALAALADTVREEGGPDYDVVTQAGAAAQFGPLRLGLLVARAKADVVRREGAAPARFDEATGALTPSPGVIEPDSVAFENSRIPLALEVCVRGKQVIIVVVHLSSRLADDPLMGPRQPPNRRSTARRVAQAERVVAVTGPVVRAGRAVVVLGDFNDTPASETLRVFEDAGLEDLTNVLPRSDRYSYVFEGASALLDHVLVPSALAAAATVDVVHGSADRAAVRRDTDHDPVVARVSLGEAPACVVPR